MKQEQAKSNDSQMNVKRLSDDQLIASAEQQFAIERKTSHYILLHLKEISVRRVYAKRGFPNLREMLIKHFRQSETAAKQRLKSLELMLDVPVVEERLISGDLNMSTVAMAQRQISREEKLTGKELSKAKKVAIVESITNKTMANAEIELFKLLPETASHPETYERRVSEHATRLNLTVPNDVMEMLIRLKEIWAHIDPTMDHVEIIRRSFKMTLQKIDPAQRSIKQSGIRSDLKVSKCEAPRRQESTQVEPKQDVSNHEALKRETSKHEESKWQESKQKKSDLKCNQDQTESFSSTKLDTPQNPTQSLTESVKHRGTKRPTYYRKAIDRALWRRAGFCCEFTDEKSGRRCSSRFGLQREHVVPLALGGSNDLSNMQLLCFTHNQLRARQVFGNKKIDGFQMRTRSNLSDIT